MLQRIAMSLPHFATPFRAGGMDHDARLSRAKFRAWHRGTREADYLVGGFFATILGLGGDGLVPVSTLGREHFRWEENAKRLVGDDSGTTYSPGDRLELRLAEANPLTGALKFELPDAQSRGTGRVEPRGNRPQPRPKGNHSANPRGRPGNIRHQGRKR
jgi:ribonuclease R